MTAERSCLYRAQASHSSSVERERASAFVESGLGRSRFSALIERERASVLFVSESRRTAEHSRLHRA